MAASNTQVASQQRVDDGIYATPSAAAAAAETAAPKAKGQRGRAAANKRLNPRVQDEIVPSSNNGAQPQAQTARPKRGAAKPVSQSDRYDTGRL